MLKLNLKTDTAKATLFLQYKDVKLVAFEEGTSTTKDENGDEVKTEVSFLRVMLYETHMVKNPQTNRKESENVSYMIFDKEDIQEIIDQLESSKCTCSK